MKSERRYRGRVLDDSMADIKLIICKYNKINNNERLSAPNASYANFIRVSTDYASKDNYNNIIIQTTACLSTFIPTYKNIIYVR